MSKIAHAVRHASEYFPCDLALRYQITRVRAEEALAAMISGAVLLKTLDRA